MEYVPCPSPFNSCFACASDQLTRWACLANVSGTRASSFAHGPRIDVFTLPLSSKLRWDTVLLSLFWLDRILQSPLNCERFSLSSIDQSWIANQIASTTSRSTEIVLLGFLGLLWRVVRASYGSHSRSHHLSPTPPPIPFLFFCWTEQAHVFV